MSVTSGITNMTIEEQNVLLAKLMEKENKAKATAKAYREKNADKMKQWSERARVRSLLLAKKARERGITVSDEEVDEYLAGRNEEE